MSVVTLSRVDSGNNSRSCLKYVSSVDRVSTFRLLSESQTSRKTKKREMGGEL